jgi:hypothetical protein
MRETDRQLIASLKQQQPFTGFRSQTDDGTECKVQFIGRGEVAFYQEGERGLLLEALAGSGVIVARSIREWDTGEKVTASERAAIIERVSDALRQLGATKVEVV